MKKVIDGCAAVANIAYKFSELASIYPIIRTSLIARAMIPNPWYFLKSCL